MPQQARTRQSPPRKADSDHRSAKYVVVRYGRMGHVGLFRHYLDSAPERGTMLVIRSQRGTELGRVLVNVGDEPRSGFIPAEELDEYLRANGPDYPFHRGGRVLRPANPQDLNDQQHLDRSARDEGAYCREQIAQLSLDMRLVEVEHLLGGERIVFFFTAEHRVDFRELVKQMAGQYHTRIEMRQVGARDEARLVGDYERCGLHCCCREFLKFLKPVSMRMAKMQKATLDPTKISGRCGRLMCCLRFEDATYEELQGALPKKGKWVRSADGTVGKVADVQLLTQLVALVLPDGQRTVVANEEIVDRDVPPSPPSETPMPAPAAPAPPPRPPPAQPKREDLLALDELDEKLDELTAGAKKPAAAPAPPTKPAEAPEAAKPQRRQKKPRRRRRKKRHPQALSAAPSLGSKESSPGRPSGRQGERGGPPAGKGKKRRGRKKRRGGGRPNRPPGGE